MTNITKLAKHIKARGNPSPYTPMFGKIISLPMVFKFSNMNNLNYIIYTILLLTLYI